MLSNETYFSQHRTQTFARLYHILLRSPARTNHLETSRCFFLIIFNWAEGRYNQGEDTCRSCPQCSMQLGRQHDFFECSCDADSSSIAHMIYVWSRTLAGAPHRKASGSLESSAGERSKMQNKWQKGRRNRRIDEREKASQTDALGQYFSFLSVLYSMEMYLQKSSGLSL